MSGKKVTFDSSSSRSSRGSRSRDSALGSSSSSEQASLGGKPDRKFTDQDRAEQWTNPAALQEALQNALSDVNKLKDKVLRGNNDLAAANKSLREKDALWKEECDRSERLEHENTAQRIQIKELKDAVDEWRDRYHDTAQRLLNITQPVNDTAMTGGSGEPGRLGRRKSVREREAKDQKERLLERINKTSQDSEASSKQPRRNSRRMSVSGPAGSRKPYIESMDSPPRQFDNYVPAPASPIKLPLREASKYSHVPRTSQPTSPIYRTPTSDYSMTSSGDYQPFPLPDEKGKRKS